MMDSWLCKRRFQCVGFFCILALMTESLTSIVHGFNFYKEIKGQAFLLSLLTCALVADIVCIKAFYDEQSRKYVVSMGLVKEEGSCFFNIYAAQRLNDLPEQCICLSELVHFPVQVVYTYFMSPTTRALQWAFLLSTSGSLPPPLDLNEKSSTAAPVQVYTRLVDAALCKVGSVLLYLTML
ncbi:unnamed protein product [Hydatigera taeniaeformis]|uniref:XK-related protein n=1 Tax=Hydatigena taeniaeformis TaxID=6205 RepID=A0A0R3WQV2_HYDTA|nr:unnamed protein product [Hydatigera taeniaeformis]